jgi:hypothetical protein
MTADDVLKAIVLMERRLSEGLSEEEAQRLVVTLYHWTESPLLLPIAELIARAWLERDPSSAEARRVVHDCLVSRNRIADAQAVAAGQPPTGLLVDSPEEREHAERLLRAAEARLVEG